MSYQTHSHTSFFFFFICSEFCHTLEWNSHGFTCVPHPDPPSHLPLHQKVPVSWKNMSYSKISSVQSLSGVWLLPCSNSCPLTQWCHPTISSSVIPFSSHLQSFPAAESFQMSQFFASGAQSIGVQASASVIPMNIQDWFPLGFTGWISLKSKGLSRVFFNTIVQKHQFFRA